MEKNTLPIGVIDSGKGGKGVIHYLSFGLKNENFLFYMDSKNFPYGNKSRSEIFEIGKDAIKMVQDKTKIIVIACNTLSCYINKNNDISIIKINECIVEKVKRKKYKNVLFLTTSLTNKSNYFQNECEKYQIKYKIKSCPELVEMVENNLINKDKIKDILKEEFNGNYDAIVLGCTHFYYLEKDITKLFPNAKIITGFDVLLSKIKKELKLLKLKNSRVNKSKISVYKT